MCGNINTVLKTGLATQPLKCKSQTLTCAAAQCTVMNMYWDCT